MTDSTSNITSEDLHAIQNTNLNVAAGVQLTELQRKHAGVVLDLFQAKGDSNSLRSTHKRDG